MSGFNELGETARNITAIISLLAVSAGAVGYVLLSYKRFIVRFDSGISIKLLKGSVHDFASLLVMVLPILIGLILLVSISLMPESIRFVGILMFIFSSLFAQLPLMTTLSTSAKRAEDANKKGKSCGLLFAFIFILAIWLALTIPLFIVAGHADLPDALFTLLIVHMISVVLVHSVYFLVKKDEHNVVLIDDAYYIVVMQSIDGGWVCVPYVAGVKPGSIKILHKEATIKKFGVDQVRSVDGEGARALISKGNKRTFHYYI